MPRPLWTTFAPILGGILLAATWGRQLGPLVLAVVAVTLVAAVFAAVHHAEVVAPSRCKGACTSSCWLPSSS